jgi:hypothetical protein
MTKKAELEQMQRRKKGRNGEESPEGRNREMSLLWKAEPKLSG